MALLSANRLVADFGQLVGDYQSDQVTGLLRQVGIESLAHRACADLAYSDVKRLELAMALAHRPELLLMDEPTAGMAPAERLQLMALVKALVAERQMAVLFTEHSMDVVFTYADRVIVLAGGQLIADGTPEQIKDDRRWLRSILVVLQASNHRSCKVRCQQRIILISGFPVTC